MINMRRYSDQTDYSSISYRNHMTSSFLSYMPPRYDVISPFDDAVSPDSVDDFTSQDEEEPYCSERNRSQTCTDILSGSCSGKRNDIGSYRYHDDDNEEDSGQKLYDGGSRQTGAMTPLDETTTRADYGMEYTRYNGSSEYGVSSLKNSGVRARCDGTSEFRIPRYVLYSQYLEVFLTLSI